MKKALITGINGQDGFYLSKLLLEKNYEVHGIVREEKALHLNCFKDNIFFHKADLIDSKNIERLIKEIQPDEVYNLAAQSSVGKSFNSVEYTGEVTGLGAVRILEAIKNIKPDTKFYQASSSEMFAESLDKTITENTHISPCSPYGCAKVYAHLMTKNYRTSFNIFACTGILFNHESPMRGEQYVTRKITRSLARIKLKREKKLSLGNINNTRDWGHANDYVYGMWLMMQQDKPDDYILATNKTHSIREFVEKSAQHLDFDIIWEGKGLEEKGIDKKTGKIIIDIDEKYFRPAEVNIIQGDYSKAKKILGWEPKISFEELVREMTKNDFNKEK